MDHVTVLFRDALPGLDLIAIDRREGGERPPRAPIYLARKRTSGVHAGGVYDPVPMPEGLRGALESIGLFVPAA